MKWTCFTALLPLAAGASPVPGVAPEPLPVDRADYEIAVTLDPETGLLEGRQTVVWTHDGPGTTVDLAFHQYWNAWRNDRSTWMLEDRLRERTSLPGRPQAGDWGWLTVDSIRFEGEELVPRSRYLALDDGNPEDRTVWVVRLPRAVQSGETVEADLTWRAKVPRTFARTGFRGDFFFIAHWFPQLCVLEGGRWNCHQFHASTEFFADFGSYDVSITLPERFVVAATGRPVERMTAVDGLVTHRFRQDRVHGFAWTASPDYVEVEDSLPIEGREPVEVRLLMQPEHLGQSSRHLEALGAAFRSYSEWFGPYPHDQVTVVDPAWGSGAGGMEYPTLFTAGTRLFNPRGGGDPEGVTVHEAGHQWWYSVVGNNEIEAAWLDEGLNSFAAARAYARTWGEERLAYRFFRPPGLDDERGFFAVLLDGFDHRGRTHLDRLARYRPDATADDQARPSFRYPPDRGGSLSYSKTALWLGTLEGHVGWPELQRILATFYARWSFGHPKPGDFLDVVGEISGPETQRLVQGFLGSSDYDYGVESIDSFPAAMHGWREESGTMLYRDPESPGESDGPADLFRSEVVFRRHGSGTFPVRVRLQFEDGSELLKSWNGKSRWLKVVEIRAARVSAAQVDPDGVLLLDLHPSDNELLAEPRSLFPSLKWTARWLVWLQDRLLAMSAYL